MHLIGRTLAIPIFKTLLCFTQKLNQFFHDRCCLIICCVMKHVPPSFFISEVAYFSFYHSSGITIIHGIKSEQKSFKVVANDSLKQTCREVL